MIIEFEKFLNEEITTYDEKHYLEELSGAKYLTVDYGDINTKWGIRYTKNGETKFIGGFQLNDDVHEFLIDHNIDYGGKQGYLVMKKYREDKKKIPYQSYQRDLMLNGIKDMLEEN